MKSKRLITGASRGIGRNAALFLGKTFPQSRLIICATDNKKLVEVAKEVNDHNGKETVIPIAGDLTDLKMAQHLEAVVKGEFGAKLDSLILNHARALPFKKIANLTDEEMEKDIPKIFSTNLFSYIQISNKMMPFLRRSNKDEWGRIVLVSSAATLPSNFVPSWAPYTMTKTAVNTLAAFLNLGFFFFFSFLSQKTKKIHQKNQISEEKKNRVLTLAYAPGVVDTDMQVLSLLLYIKIFSIFFSNFCKTDNHQRARKGRNARKSSPNVY